MKKIYALLLILLTAGCSKNEANKKEDQNFDLKEPKQVYSNYTPQGSDVPYTGKVFSLWANGNVEVEGSYKDGKPDGLTTFWYETGEKKNHVVYKDNEREGIQIEWHKNGKKKIEQKFNAGKLLSENFWDKDGNSVDSLDDANK